MGHELLNSGSDGSLKLPQVIAELNPLNDREHSVSTIKLAQISLCGSHSHECNAEACLAAQATRWRALWDSDRRRMHFQSDSANECASSARSG